MADQFNRSVVSGRAGADVQIDEGLRTYMLRVYNYMVTGLALTGAVAWIVASTPSVFNAIFGTGLQWIVILAPLGLVIFLSARINKMSAAAAQISYWVFAGLMGLSLASIFVIYTGESIARVFFITAATFAAMSLYGYTTKRNISNWGSFLMMGLIGIIIAMVVNIFLQSAAMQYVISVLGVLIFTGLTAYDTQQIKGEFIAHRMEGEVASKSAIMGAVRLYLDFLNLFIFLLHLIGNRN
jgi:FtsH-binding integral membrane protein